MAKFISNGIGINSINDDELIPAGWSEITEAEARESHPDLFGAEPVKPAAKKPEAEKAEAVSDDK